MTDYKFLINLLSAELWRGVLRPEQFNVDVPKEARRLARVLRREFVMTRKEEDGE